MGSTSWVAVRQEDKYKLLKSLNLRPSYNLASSGRSPFRGCELENGWYLIKGDAFFDKALSKAAIAEQSDLIVGLASYPAKTSAIAHYKNGEEVFSVAHASAKGCLHLEVSGQPPEGLPRMKAAMQERQSYADSAVRYDGKDAHTNYFFFVPLLLSNALCHFRPDIDTKLTGHTFHPLILKNSEKYGGLPSAAGGSDNPVCFPKIPFRDSSFFDPEGGGNIRVRLKRVRVPSDKDIKKLGMGQVFVYDRMKLEDFLLELIKTDQPPYHNWYVSIQAVKVSAALLTQGRESLLICKSPVRMHELQIDDKPVNMTLRPYRPADHEDWNSRLLDLMADGAKCFKIDRMTGEVEAGTFDDLKYKIGPNHPAQNLLLLSSLNAPLKEAPLPKAPPEPIVLSEPDWRMTVKVHIDCTSAGHEAVHGRKDFKLPKTMLLETFLKDKIIEPGGALLRRSYYVEAPDLCAVIKLQGSTYKVISHENMTLKDLAVEGSSLTIIITINDINDEVIERRMDHLISNGVQKLDAVQAAWLGVSEDRYSQGLNSMLASYPNLKRVLAPDVSASIEVPKTPAEESGAKFGWLRALGGLLSFIGLVVSIFR